jgi:hypothetical protein
MLPHVDLPQFDLIVYHLVEPVAFALVGEHRCERFQVQLQQRFFLEQTVELFQQLDVPVKFEKAEEVEEVEVDLEVLVAPGFERFVAAGALDGA